MKDLIKYWPIALFLIQGGLGWALWSLRQVVKGDISAARDSLKADDARIEGDVRKLDQRTGKAEGRLDAVERKIDELPTKADLARVEERVSAVDHNVLGVGRGVSRLENLFLTRGVDAVNS